MKFTFALTAFLAADVAVASSWFSKAAYNKWHETELERWLSDNDVPYPTPADRKDLENLIKNNWQSAVESPYVNWDTNRLQKQVEAQGVKVKKGTEQNKDALVKQVKDAWAETAVSANTAYEDVKGWIFDSWSESQLKAFADYHSIPVPQPRARDQALKAVRENYQTAANKLSETAAYPGNWLYKSWSESDLKAWLDENGIPAPQTSNRDKLVAYVRRNSRIASVNAQKLASQALSSASASAEAAQETLSDKIFDSWSDSELKAWADKNGIKVPQGSKRNELLAIARKNVAKLTGDNVSDAAARSASSVSKEAGKQYGAASKEAGKQYSAASKEAGKQYGAATTAAGNEFAKATDDAQLKAQDLGAQLYDQAVYYFDQAQIALGFKTNYASSASRSVASATKSASSAAAKASKAAKGEL